MGARFVPARVRLSEIPSQQGEFCDSRPTVGTVAWSARRCPPWHGRRMPARSLPMIRPMLATLGDLPGLPGWGFEFKWDGVRAIVTLDRGQLRVASRNDRDVADAYPE